MGSLFSELKRRKVFRVTAAYLVGAWAILEFVSVVAPMLRLPEWAGPLVLVLLSIGLVGAVALSWTFEVTADGLRRTAPTAGPAVAANSRLDWALMVACVAIIALVSYQQIFTRSGGPGERSVVNAAAPAVGSISIAVLPFLNLSGDPNQEFFSDGMTEEITSTLAKVPSLTVVGRTSAFEFKGQNRDLRAIAQALGVRYLLEGSVRKSGSRVRITGQLIRAENGAHVWTDNYDRELTDIFATQDDIARAIAAALQAPLGLKAGESLVANRNIDPENYQKYLRAKALYRARGVIENRTLGQATSLLEEVTAGAPDYAPAWALLSLTYGLAGTDTEAFLSGNYEAVRKIDDVSHPKAEAAARRAFTLDPRNADAYVGLGLGTAVEKQSDVEDFYRQALELDASNPEALHFYSVQTALLGRLKDALAMREKLRAIEPLVPIFTGNTALLLWVDGQNEAAIALAKTIPENQTNRVNVLAGAYAAMGRYGEAVDVLRDVSDKATTAYAAARFGAAARILSKAPGPLDSEDMPNLGGLSFIYLYVGATERAALTLSRLGPSRAIYLHSAYGPVRKTAAFKAWAREMGLVDYWRARGWPEMCRPVGADDFECD